MLRIFIVLAFSVIRAINLQSPIRNPQYYLIYLRSDLFEVVALQYITDFDIVKVFNADTAFVAGLYFFYIILESSQRGIFAVIQLNSVSDNPNILSPFKFPIRDVTAGDRPHPGLA